MNFFGTIAAIFEFLLPFIFYIWQNIRLLKRPLGKLCGKLLKIFKIKNSDDQNSQNSQNEANKQISQSQNLIANEMSHQNNENELKIMNEKNIYINNN